MNIDVILVVENGERYLQEALDSVAANLVPGMTTFVFDGQSIDRTCEIAAGHGLRPVMRTQNAKGHAPALNQAIAETDGEWLTFIDCDDVWPEGRMDALLRVAASSGAEWVYGKAVNCNSDLTPMGQPQLGRLLTTSLIRRTVAAKLGPLRTDITHGSNIDWMARAHAAGVQFAPVDELVLMRRIHDRNMGVTGKEKARSDLFQILRDHRARSRS